MQPSQSCTSELRLRAEKGPQATCQFLSVPELGLAFPNYQYIPPSLAQGCFVPAIALNVPRDLGEPIFGIGLRLPGAANAIVAMPKTTIHLNDLASAQKDEIRVSRQILSV